MKKIGNISNIPIVQGRNNEIKNQIKAEINIDGTLSFKKRNSLGELTPLTYIDVQGNNAKSRRKVGELFNKPLISSPTHLIKKKEILVQKSNEGIILGIKVNNDIKIISKNDFFTITALASGDIQISIPGNVILQSQDGKEFIPFKSISYSKDLINWKTEYPKSTIRGKEFDGYRTINIPVNKGDKVYLKGDALCWYTNCDGTSTRSSNNNLHIASTAKFSISGNILSLFYEDNFKNYNTFPKIPSGEYDSYSPRHFSFVFYESTFLYNAQELKLPNDAPELCYYSTFYGCTSLVQAPKLPATTLKYNCYGYMFKRCVKLSQAPELPATTLATRCYGSMFEGCSNLNYVKAMFTEVPSEGNSVGSWLKNVSPTGTFIKSKDATWTNEQAKIPTGWVVVDNIDIQGDYLTLSALEDGEITINISSDLGTACATSLSYSKDKLVWEKTDINGKDHTITIPVSRGDNVYLKGKAKQWYNQSGPGGISINSSADINVSGNIMSLLYEDNFEDKTVFPDNSQYTFSWLFGNNKHLCSAEKLILPATTLAVGCYRFMFRNCSSLTTAPALPATKLVDHCYWGMFNSCTSLNSITMLATNISAWNCLNDWVSGVAATGTFKKAASMTSLPSGVSGIPTGWTVKTV